MERVDLAGALLWLLDHADDLHLSGCSTTDPISFPCDCEAPAMIRALGVGNDHLSERWEIPAVDPCGFCPHDNTEQAEDGTESCDCGFAGRVYSPLAPLGAISRAINEAIGRALALGDPALRDLLIRIGNAVDDVINDLEDADDA
jgi:hypothetical protein